MHVIVDAKSVFTEPVNHKAGCLYSNILQYTSSQIHKMTFIIFLFLDLACSAYNIVDHGIVIYEEI